MSRSWKIGVLGSMAAVGWVGSASAALIAYEGMNYLPPTVAAGTELSASPSGTGGTGWTAGWGGNNLGFTTNPTGGLSYAGLQTLAGAVSDPGVNPNTNQAYSRQTSGSSLATVTSNTARWFSLLLDVDALTATPTANSRALWAGLSNASATSTAVGSNVGFSLIANAAGNGYQLAARIGSTDATSRINLTLSGQTLFLVGKYTSSASGTDFAELWLNPDATLLGGGDLTSGSLAGGYSSVALNSSIDARAFVVNATGAGSGNSFAGSLDEIRVGDTFADVSPVPEPAGLALVACGAAMMLWGRARRDA